MPSHIFTRLGLWDESIASNLASAEKARNYIARVMPGVTSFDELHAVDYLVYAYLQRGQNDKARALRDRLSEVSKFDVPNFAAAYALGAVPARYAIERRQWKEAAALTVPPNELWEKFPYAEANIQFAIALGAARSNQPDVARRALDRLSAIHQRLVEKKDPYWADQVEIQRLSAGAWLTHDLEMMRAAAGLEASTEKHPVTPGAIIPARELLSEMLLDLGKPEESLAEAQRALRDAPNRYNGLVLAAQAAERAGKADEAKAYRAKIGARCPARRQRSRSAGADLARSVVQHANRDLHVRVFELLEFALRPLDQLDPRLREQLGNADLQPFASML
jgi:tetratricopeptide (TPR) repeat protein